MFEKLESIELRLGEIDNIMSRSGLTGAELTRLSRERAGYADIVEAYQQYKRVKAERDQAKVMLNEEPDQEMRTMAKEELDLLEDQVIELEKLMQVLTLPKDPNDHKNIMLEVRAGTG
ncbi:MAG: PCRF domain-containing protein, partial [Bdellovibrionota bacterium]